MATRRCSLPYLALITVIAAVRFGVNFTRRYATARIGIAVEARLRGMMYDAYLRFPRAFYDRHATGEVISRATNDIYPVRYFIGWGVVQAIQSVMMLIGASIVLLSVNARLTLFAALAMPPVAILTYVFAHKVFPISRVVQAKKGHLTEATDEAVVGHRDGAGLRPRGRRARALHGPRRGSACRDDAPGGHRGALPARA